MVSVETNSNALPLTGCVEPVSLAGTALDVTAYVHLVAMVTAAGRSVHSAGIMNPVTKKLGNVERVTLDGLDQGVRRPALTGRLETPAASCVVLVSMATVIM